MKIEIKNRFVGVNMNLPERKGVNFRQGEVDFEEPTGTEDIERELYAQWEEEK